MLDLFLRFIKKENLGDPSQRYLLAVSGGVDSAVMCDLFRKAGFSFGIAHCNFRLRGKESGGDEAFVKSLALKYGVPFYKKSFDTKSHTKKKKISVQMSARELRYAWFNRLALDKKYDLIATAHHLDDSIETFFINLLRGTGIAGLHGIPARYGNVVRPLLFANKKRIREYAETNGLEWREDSSNFTDKYLRNSIRHHLIPSLKNLNQGFEKTITKELSYFREAGEIFKKFIEEKKKEIMEHEGKNILLNIQKLKESGHAETVLHEILRAYDFTPETTELVAQRMYSIAGKKFFSPTYRLIKDRDFLILTPKKNTWKASFPSPAGGIFFIDKAKKEFRQEGLFLKIDIADGNISAVKNKSASVAHLDLERLRFPLALRKWKQGDFFHPLGMKGRKKLSDFFVDIKLPLYEKENIWVLESGPDIAWVVGYRIDDRFKVLPGTKTIYRVSQAGQ